MNAAGTRNALGALLNIGTPIQVVDKIKPTLVTTTDVNEVTVTSGVTIRDTLDITVAADGLSANLIDIASVASVATSDSVTFSLKATENVSSFEFVSPYTSALADSESTSGDTITVSSISVQDLIDAAKLDGDGDGDDKVLTLIGRLSDGSNDSLVTFKVRVKN
jgi:hypothetical protein